MNMLDTFQGSYFSEIFPQGWDLEKIRNCVTNAPETVLDRQGFWHRDFHPVRLEAFAFGDPVVGISSRCAARI